MPSSNAVVPVVVTADEEYIFLLSLSHTLSLYNSLTNREIKYNYLLNISISLN